MTKPLCSGWTYDPVEDGSPFVYVVCYWTELGWNPYSIYVGFVSDFKDCNTFKQKFEDQIVEWDDFTFISPRFRCGSLYREMFYHVQRHWSLTSIEQDVHLWNPRTSSFEKQELIVKFKGT